MSIFFNNSLKNNHNFNYYFNSLQLFVILMTFLTIFIFKALFRTEVYFILLFSPLLRSQRRW